MSGQRITPLQLFFLTFSYLYGGFILSRGVWEAGENAWIAALLGTALGAGWYFFLGKGGEKGFSFGKMGKIACFLFFLVRTWENLEEYGLFCRGELIPGIPPMLYAAALGVLCLYASSLGLTAIGRFAEVSAFALLPLVLLLFFGFLTSSPRGSLAPALPEGAFALLRGTCGVFFTTFGDGVLLLSLADRVVPRTSPDATVWARADAEAARETFPRLPRLPFSPYRSALLCGAVSAGLLLTVTVVRDQRAIGAETLSPLRFPFAYAAHETQSEVLMPFFTLCLLLVCSVRTMLLFSSCAGIAEEKVRGGGPLLPAVILFSLLSLSSVCPGAAERTGKNPLFVLLFASVGFLAPIFREIRFVFQKRFDKSKRI